MSEFDYKAAWKAIAFPAVLSLPQNLRTLFLATAEEALMLRQNEGNLDVPWPNSDLSKLHHRFDKVPAEWLSQASRAFHSFGHWACDDWEIAGRYGNGAYWKFSNYADQSLSARLGIKRNRADKIPAGVSFAVLEGAIRGCVYTPFSWTWKEIGPATHKTWNACKAATFPAQPTVPYGRREADAYEDAAMGVIASLRLECMVGSFRDLCDTDRFMVEKLSYRW